MVVSFGILRTDSQSAFGRCRPASITMAALSYTNRTRLLSLGLAFLLALLAGCAAPLGPGYHIRRESVTVHYRPGMPAFNYRVDAEVRNVGDRPLSSLTMRVPRFPPDATNAAQNSAQGVTTAANGEEMRFSLPLEPALGRRKSRRVRFSYVVPVRGEGLLLEPQDWFPVFLPPHVLFAKGVPRAPRTELKILVPRGYRALATGRLRGIELDRSGGEAEYRYEMRRGDFSPFLLIGRFEQQRIRSGKTEVVFWTRQPVSAACAHSLATHLATTLALYRSDFGSIRKHQRPIPMIEISPESAASIPEEGTGFGSVPGGLWFSVAPSELCARPGHFFMAADRAMAATWFGWAVAPEPDARAILGGVRRYAALLAESSRKGTAVQARQVRAWIDLYDELRSQAKPLAPVRLSWHPLPAQRRMAGIQSALFLIALRDRFGPEPVRRALAHLVSALQNSTVGLDDLRSALEQETGNNLFDFFREWLGRPGIPTNFRQRYSARKSERHRETGSSLIFRRAR